MKLDRDGVQLGYDEAGSGESSMLLIHGAFADRSSYSEQFDHFAADHRVVGVSMGRNARRVRRERGSVAVLRAQGPCD